MTPDGLVSVAAAVAPTGKPVQVADLTPEQRKQYTAFMQQKKLRLLRQQQTQQVPRMLRAVDAVTYAMIALLLAMVWGGYTRYMPDLMEELRMPTGDPECLALTTWIEENGGWVTGARCVKSPQSGGRGIFASGNLQEGDRYASIPRDLWFWEQSVIMFSDVGQLLDEDQHLKDNLGTNWAHNGDPFRLIAALVYEAIHVEESHWQPFIESMPSMPTSPVWWDEVQIAALESPVLADRITKLQDGIADNYNTYMVYLMDEYPDHFNVTGCDLEKFTWASLHMYGRAFDSTNPWHSSLRSWALIPYIDLVNHAGHPNGGYQDSKSNSNPSGDGPFTAEATDCQRYGGELFHSYGARKSATHYLITYGFIPTGYEAMDYVSLSMSDMAANTVQQAAVSAGPHRYPWTAGYTGTDGHVTEGFIDAYGFYLMNQAQRELATHPNSVSTRKLAGVKITPRAAMSADPAAQLPDANVLVLPGGGAVNISAFDFTWGCTRALEVMLQQVQIQLQTRFTTSYAEDFADLNGPFTGYNNWVSLTARVRYKRILIRLEKELKHRLAHDGMDPLAWGSPTEWWNLAHQSDFISAKKKEASVQNSLFELKLPDSVAIFPARDPAQMLAFVDTDGEHKGPSTWPSQAYVLRVSTGAPATSEPTQQQHTKAFSVRSTQ